jgi:hypothetical protein
LVSFALGFAGATVFAGGFGLFSIGIEVALTLLLMSAPVALFGLGLVPAFAVPAFAVPAASSPFCSA